MSGDDADRNPPQPPEKERGVHVSRDAPGAEATGGRKRSKLGFRVQAQRREKWDDPVFDNVRESGSPPEPAAQTADAVPDPGTEPEVVLDSGSDNEVVPDDGIDTEAVPDDDVDAESAKEKEDAPASAVERFKRFFFRGGADRST